MRAKIVPAAEGWNNFHTHTFRCHHADGDVEDYARRAAQLGMRKLGMSDHAYIRGLENHRNHMGRQDVPDYVEKCREADRMSADLQVFCGVECDYDPCDESFFREFYLEEMGMDYLVGSVHELKGRTDVLDCFSRRHFGVKELRLYTDLYIRLMESRLFTFCAHPDLFGRPVEIGENPPGWDENAQSAAKEILEAAQACGSVLEINVSGVWKTVQRGYPQIIYPRTEFWEMASDYRISVIVNSDAHSPERLDESAGYGLALVEKYGLKRVELG